MNTNADRWDKVIATRINPKSIFAIRFRLLPLLLLTSCAGLHSHSNSAPRSVSVRLPSSCFTGNRAPSQEALQASVDSAIAGSNKELRRILSLSLNVTPDNQIFGSFLLALQEVVGMERFHRAMSDVPEAARQRALGQMRAADPMAQWNL